MSRYTTYYYELKGLFYVWDNQINGMIAGTGSKALSIVEKLASHFNKLYN